MEDSLLVKQSHVTDNSWTAYRAFCSCRDICWYDYNNTQWNYGVLMVL